MIKLTLSLAIVSCSILAVLSSKLAILEHPPNYQFDLTNKLELEDFKNLVLATGGHPISKPLKWDGLKNGDSFLTPKATILFLADGSTAKLDSLMEKSVPIVQNSDADFGFLQSAINEEKTAYESFENVPSQVDRQKLDKDCQKKSLFYVVHIGNEPADKIKSFYQNVSSECNLKDNMVVYLLSIDYADGNRVKRQAPLPAKLGAGPIVLNQAVFYSDQYPAMFNLIFWTSLILALAVFAVSYSMCYMDPGLNTVIYRMTSQRIKKDQ